MDWTYLYPLSWWVPQVKCVGVYIFVFQELEGKFRASNDCLQACHSAVQVVRTPKYLSTLPVPTSLADLTNTRVLSWSSQNTNTIMTCFKVGAAKQGRELHPGDREEDIHKLPQRGETNFANVC